MRNGPDLLPALAIGSVQYLEWGDALTLHRPAAALVEEVELAHGRRLCLGVAA